MGKNIGIEVSVLDEMSKDFFGYKVERFYRKSKKKIIGEFWAKEMSIKDDYMICQEKWGIFQVNNEIVRGLKKADKRLYGLACEFARSFGDCSSFIKCERYYSREDVVIVSWND